MVNNMKTLVWWLVLGIFVGVVAVVYVSRVTSVSAIVEHVNTTYDFVIVGAGTAGSVLANRLTEDGKHTVLLLEAGGEETRHPNIYVPLLSNLERANGYDWGYSTVTQKNANMAMQERKSVLSRGLLFGGTSSINNLVYLRGTSKDYDDWAANGSVGWNYKQVLPYFLKSEDFLPESQKSSVYHSKGGPLPVSNIDVPFEPLADVFQQSLAQMGYKTIDCNTREALGMCTTQVTTDNGVRQSTANTFLKPVMTRKNLHIATFAQANKVLISNNRAVGVEYLRNGRKEVVGARKEVILSAGPIGSPHILMMSGVGPAPHLLQLNIPVHSDIPVGSNLHDPMMMPIRVLINESYTITPARATSVISKLKYKILGSGMLSSSGGIVGTAFVNADDKSKTKYPDVVLSMMATFPELWESGRYNYHKYLAKEFYATASQNQNNSEGFTLWIQVAKSSSSGTMKLKSTNPFDHPDIDPEYLESDEDVHTLVRGIKFALRLIRAKPFQLKLRAKVLTRPFSKCAKHKFNSDPYLECLVRNLAVSSNNPSGTCKMGAIEDNSTVVDPQLRVKGIQRLRVVDASVMPSPVTGNTYAPVVMIAEKASDLIRKSYNKEAKGQKRQDKNVQKKPKR